jgi:hypothetical protein
MPPEAALTPSQQRDARPDPLDALLRDAARRTTDADVRGWLLALLDGERASSEDSVAVRHRDM